MKAIHLFPLLALGVALSGCQQRLFVSGESEAKESARFVGFTVNVDTKFKKEPVQSSDLKADEMCDLDKGAKLSTASDPVFTEHHYKAVVTSDSFKCSFKTGYVFSDHVTATGEGSDSPYCQRSWEEAPGTTDYTTYDAYNGAYFPDGDRAESKTLIGSGVQKNRTLCEKARALKHCFVRTVVNADNASARTFRSWAASHGINPMLALMAKTQQETKMGALPDSCSGGNCNGIGIGQIITAIDENGAPLSNSDRRWRGITFNILTNLTYSVRVIAQKTPMSGSLYDLAYYYNGSSGAAQYASNVVGFYQDLKGCGL